MVASQESNRHGDQHQPHNPPNQKINLRNTIGFFTHPLSLFPQSKSFSFGFILAFFSAQQVATRTRPHISKSIPIQDTYVCHIPYRNNSCGLRVTKFPTHCFPFPLFIAHTTENLLLSHTSRRYTQHTEKQISLCSVSA